MGKKFTEDHFCSTSKKENSRAAELANSTINRATLCGLLSRKESEITRLTERIAALEAPTPCNVCLGKPLASDAECICEGAGTEAAEIVGLRKCADKLQAENSKIKNSRNETIQTLLRRDAMVSELQAENVRLKAYTSLCRSHWKSPENEGDNLITCAICLLSRADKLQAENERLKKDYERAFNRGLEAGNEQSIAQQKAIHKYRDRADKLQARLDAVESKLSALIEKMQNVITT